MFNGIWLQLKFGEIFWVEVKIDARGPVSKRSTTITDKFMIHLKNFD